MCHVASFVTRVLASDLHGSGSQVSYGGVGIQVGFQQHTAQQEAGVVRARLHRFIGRRRLLRIFLSCVSSGAGDEPLESQAEPSASRKFPLIAHLSLRSPLTR